MIGKEPAGREPFEAVYEKYFSAVYNYVYASFLHREKTEDLVSDIFIKAMTHYDQFDPRKASVKTWLTHIARNTVIDEFRKNSGKTAVSLDDEDSGVEPSYEDEYGIFREDQEKEVLKILSALSLNDRELIAMIYFEDMKNEEIARVLGISAKAVSERHRRLLVRCRAVEKGVDPGNLL